MSFIKSLFKGSPELPASDGALASPPSKEVSDTIDALVMGKIPSKHQPGVKAALRRILEAPDHKPYGELIARSSHPCVLEYLPSVLQLLQSQEASAVEAMRGMKPAELADFKLSSDMQKTVYYTSIAELLGKGFPIALKPNLIFDEYGNPKEVRETDKKRFPKCDATLTGSGRKRTSKKKVQKKRKTLRRRKMSGKMH